MVIRPRVTKANNTPKTAVCTVVALIADVPISTFSETNMVNQLMQVKWVHPKWINGSHRTESFNWNVCMDLRLQTITQKKKNCRSFTVCIFKSLGWSSTETLSVNSLPSSPFFFFLLPAVNKHYLGVVLPCRKEASLFRASQRLSGREGTCWDRNWRRRACFEHKTSPTSEDRGHLHYLPTQRDPVHMRVNLMIVIMIVVLYSIFMCNHCF